MKVGVGLLTTNAARLEISASHCHGLGQRSEVTSEPAGDGEMKAPDGTVVSRSARAKSKAGRMVESDVPAATVELAGKAEMVLMQKTVEYWRRGL